MSFYWQVTTGKLAVEWSLVKYLKVFTLLCPSLVTVTWLWDLISWGALPSMTPHGGWHFSHRPRVTDFCSNVSNVCNLNLANFDCYLANFKFSHSQKAKKNSQPDVPTPTRPLELVGQVCLWRIDSVTKWSGDETILWRIDSVMKWSGDETILWRIDFLPKRSFTVQSTVLVQYVWFPFNLYLCNGQFRLAQAASKVLQINMHESGWTFRYE